MALFRAASLCGNENEIVVFTVRSSSQAWGAYPWEGNGIIIQRYNMGAGSLTFAHELGHYLGLSHSFRGAGLGYDLSNPNLKNPATGAPAKLADFWDLVYKPADLPPATTTNVYFSSRAQAAGYPESSLRPIQGSSGWAQNPLGFACYGSLNNCPRPSPTARCAWPCRARASSTPTATRPSPVTARRAFASASFGLRHSLCGRRRLEGPRPHAARPHAVGAEPRRQPHEL